MLLKFMKSINYIIILYFLLISVGYSKEKPPFKNILVLEKPKTYNKIIFQDRDSNYIDLNLINSDEIYILNFWATWCAPCKDEMPSLDKLQENEGIFIFPINMEEKNLINTDKFYNNLNIKNLDVYFDEGLKLVKVFALRGVPTSIILNKNKEVVAKISGSIDFMDEKFISWLNSIR